MKYFLFLFISINSFASIRYDQISFLTTHNSFNYSKRSSLKPYGPRGYLFPNQNFPINDQLKFGVRALMLDLYKKNGEVILCHGGRACGLLGKDRAELVFKDIGRFLENHPKEIITLILESYIGTKDLENVLIKAGLFKLLFSKNSNEEWPSVQRMISTNKRLVILNDRIETMNPSWNHDLWAHAVETPFSYKKMEDLKCEFNRGNPKNSLFIFNHFTTLISGRPLEAKKINRKEFLEKRVDDCRKKLGKFPNFITVDFYFWGDSLEVVNKINYLK